MPMRVLIIEGEADLARGLPQQGYAVDIATEGDPEGYLAEVNEYDRSSWT